MMIMKKMKLKVNKKKMIIMKMMKYLKIKIKSVNFLIQIICIKNRPNL